MKIINGEEVFGIEDIKFEEDAECEHCGVLEAFDATFDDDCTHWCLDCAKEMDELKHLTEDDWKQITILEIANKINHFKERIEALQEEMITVMTGIPLEE